MSYADITPDTSLVASWANQLHRWPTITGELIDNALDANATRVILTLARDQISIEDNGVGCPDLALMFKAGKHIKHASTRLGRYGIGFKQAVTSAGRLVQVSSTHQGKLSHVAVDWERLEQSGQWQIDIDDPVDTEMPPGTLITISRLRSKSGLSRASIATLIKSLSEQYTPGIKQGRQIILHAFNKQTPLAALPLPELEYMRNVELMVGRKKASLQIGLLPEGVSYPSSALTVSYSFRVIQKNVRWGLGSDPTPGLLGWLDLLDGWNLSTNKEKVLDEDLEALEKQIAERCADIIARAAQRGYAVPLQEANAALAAMLNAMHSQQTLKKARRHSPQNPTGAIAPRHTSRRQRTAARIQPGRTFLHPNETTGFKIALAHLGIDGVLFRCQDGGIIELNADNPTIAAARMDQYFLAHIAVLGLAASQVLQPEGQQRFPFLGDPDGNLVEQIAELANRMMRHLPALREDDAA